jgi:hypothetical protein
LGVHSKGKSAQNRLLGQFKIPTRAGVISISFTFRNSVARCAHANADSNAYSEANRDAKGDILDNHASTAPNAIPSPVPSPIPRIIPRRSLADFFESQASIADRLN